MSAISLKDQGFIQIYTGNGKGKTTAALGLALRAIGHGHHVYIGQFMKGIKYGEVMGAELLGDKLTIYRYGEDTMVHPDQAQESDIERAHEGLEQIRTAMHSGKYQLVVLDEINVTVAYGLLEAEQVLELLDEKPAGVELVLTGISAPASFIERADLVSEMKEVKHYYKDKGILSRQGIDR